LTKVSIVKCNNYSKIKKSVKKSLDLLGGLDKFVEKGDKVLLKPNICEPFPPEKHANTHPELVRVVVELVKEVGGEPIIGELTTGNSPGRTQEAFEKSGIKKIADETETPIRNFQQEPFIVKDIPDYKVLEKTDFAKALFDVDVVMNLPKLKSHGITFLTGAVKNCFGCIHPGEREYLHREFSEREQFSHGLLDVYSYIKPQLNIMDAVVAMEGDEGPSHGNPRNIGLVITSEDGVALDTISAKITGHNPLAIPTCRLGGERKIGEVDISKIKVVGEELEDILREEFVKHNLFHDHKREKGFGAEYIYEPQIISEECTACGTCVDACPVNAIKIVDGKAKIDYEKCIKCFCCQEVCPSGAVKIEKKWLIDRFAPYVKKGKKIQLIDKKIANEIIFINGFELERIEKLDKNKLYLIKFELNRSKLNTETGQKIMEILFELENKGIKFKLSRPLFPCLFGKRWDEVKEQYGFPTDCMDCLELFSVEKDGMTKGCFAIDNKLGPKFEYMKDRYQLWEYFYTFLENIKVNEKCQSCIYFIRNKCKGMCLGK